MSSYVQPTHRRKRGYTESATAYKRRFPDALSPEYASSGRPQHHSGVYAYDANNAVDEDIKHALHAQERARTRRAAIDSSPRRALYTRQTKSSPSRSKVVHTTQPPTGYENIAKSPVYPSAAAMDGYSFPAAHDVQDVRTPRNSHSQRFSNIRDSLSLPYLRNRTKNKPKPPALDLHPLVHNREREVMDDQPGYSASEFGWIGTPPRETLNTKLYRESPKQLAPLPRFNPFARTRADSLSAIVEDRETYELYQEEDMTPTAPNTRMRRMKTVNDLFSRIDEEARTLGLKTSIHK
uniref:Uncharacterized protein n=1 Tax=Moniliophthora roreri TaxID=221103 RepID=A0A0W0FGB7_MONRR